MIKLIEFLTIFCSLLVLINAKLPEKQLCGDPECNSIISLAVTTLRYSSPDEHTISFPINAKVRVYSKSADVWGIEVQGRRGYAYKNMLRETKVITRSKDLIEVPVVAPNKIELKSSETVKPEIEPSITAPLPAAAAQSDIVTGGSGNVSAGKPEEASPVQDNENVFDGTKLPPMETLDEVKSEPSTNEQKPVIEAAENEENVPTLEEINKVTQAVETKTEINDDAEEDGIVEDVQEDESANRSQIVPSKTVQFLDTVLNTSTKRVPLSVQNVGEEEEEEEEEEEYEEGSGEDFEWVEERVRVDEDNEKAGKENEAKEITSHEVKEDKQETDEGKVKAVDSVTESQDVPPSASSTESPQTAPMIEENEIENFNITSQEDADELPEDFANATEEELPEETAKVVEEVSVSNNSRAEVPESDNARPSTEPPETIPVPTTPGYETDNHLEQEEHIATPDPKLKKATPTPSPGPYLPLFKNTLPPTAVPIATGEEIAAPKHIESEPQDAIESLTDTAEEMHSRIDAVIETSPNLISDPEPLSTAAPVVEVHEEQKDFDSSSDSVEALQEPPSIADPEPTSFVDPEPPSLAEPEPSTIVDRDMPSVVATSEEPAINERPTTESPELVSSSPEVLSSEHLPLTSHSTPPSDITTKPIDDKDGLFATILGTVKSFWSTNDSGNGKAPASVDDELEAILYPERFQSEKEKEKQLTKEDEGFCEKLTPNNCPSSTTTRTPLAQVTPEDCDCSFPSNFFALLSQRVLEMLDLLACLGISAATALLFSFGYYCICHTRKESALLSKLNIVERSLLASNKEASILKHDLIETRNKLASIEDNSFGSNDMVMALKRELESSEEAKERLQEQVVALEKELENAAEAGLELNKIVSELLNNQNGDESIISSVEDLQKQLNEQQNTILQINATLAEKSRENSELQLILAEHNAKFEGEIEVLKQDNEELENEKNLLQSRLDEIKTEFEMDITKALESKNSEIRLLQAEITQWQPKFDEIYRKWQTSDAKVQALEDCLKNVKKESSVDMTEFVNVANLKVEFSALTRERDLLKEKLESEADTKKMLEQQVAVLSSEVEKLKQDFNQTEKDKLEAQTRLEVLSNYFKEKETQLQKELSVKEALWMKQQGETTSTVERVRNMQEEMQALKSQNDSLRAEIEAQSAAHKAQIGTLENRAHETWLAARQSERKYEEVRSEATALRRKLTSLASAGNGPSNSVVDGLQPTPITDLNNAPSPIHMENPGSPILGGLPPPPPFLPPPFMGPPPPHFMPMPPPFMPPGEMRPPPLGRLMSPPPLPPNHPHGRYSPSILDDDDEDDDDRGHHRGRYSPRNGRYSPDSRYGGDIMSTYDTETDFSPPPSPHSRGGYDYRDRDRERDRRPIERNSRAGSFKAFSPPPQQVPSGGAGNSSHQERNNKRSTKGVLSSGSEKSFDSTRKGKGKGLV